MLYIIVGDASSDVAITPFLGVLVCRVSRDLQCIFVLLRLGRLGLRLLRGAALQQRQGDGTVIGAFDFAGVGFSLVAGCRRFLRRCLWLLLFRQIGRAHV